VRELSALIIEILWEKQVPASYRPGRVAAVPGGREDRGAVEDHTQAGPGAKSPRPEPAVHVRIIFIKFYGLTGLLP